MGNLPARKKVIDWKVSQDHRLNDFPIDEAQLEGEPRARASVPERGSNAGPAKPRLEFFALRAHNGSVCGVADMPLTGPIPEGRPFFCPHCGALYSVTDSPRPKGDNTTAKCVVCTQTMVEWASTESRVYKLIHRPEDA